jgi:putative transposase
MLKYLFGAPKPEVQHLVLRRKKAYLHAYDCVNDAKRGLEKYFRLYNQDRPHTALDDQTPDEFYFDNLPALPKAA